MTRIQFQQHVKQIVKAVVPDRLMEAAYDVWYAGFPVPIRTVRPFTLLSNINLFFLMELMRRLDEQRVEGNIIECGVYKGGSAGVLGYAVSRSPFDRRLRLYDAFRGMPKAHEYDDNRSKSMEGQLVGDPAQARRILRRVGLSDERYDVIVGWLEDTLPVAQEEAIALLHIDCDFYEPVKLVLERFYEHVEPRGYVVLNDYGGFEGCRRAADEFFCRLDLDAGLIQIDQDAYYLQKPGPNR